MSKLKTVRTPPPSSAEKAWLVKQFNDLDSAISFLQEQNDDILEAIKALAQEISSNLNQQITPELEAAVKAVKKQAKVVDEKVPDLTVTNQ
jgi:chaperonin cofactor prefoldin